LVAARRQEDDNSGAGNNLSHEGHTSFTGACGSKGYAIRILAIKTVTASSRRFISVSLHAWL
jgi:hypothetical protein